MRITVERTLLIPNKLGLHGRASARLVEVAGRYAADIRLWKNGTEVDGKSILDVLSIACTEGTPITIRATGRDAEEAVAALEQLFREKFGEKE